MKLPQDLAIQYRSEVAALEQEKAMPYVTSFEELAREEGREEGRVETLKGGIIGMLEVRFGVTLPPEVSMQVQSIDSVDVLNRVQQAIWKATNFDEAMRVLTQECVAG